MSDRGYFGAGIYCPQKSQNVGTLLRSAHSLGAAFTFTIGGQREAVKQSSNTTKSYRHVPHLHFDDFAAAQKGLPFNCELIGVEIVSGAIPLDSYEHPERAMYILGPENGSLPREVLDACIEVVSIPHGEFCYNLAVAGSIVLWHRAAQLAAVSAPNE